MFVWLYVIFPAVVECVNYVIVIVIVSPWSVGLVRRQLKVSGRTEKIRFVYNLRWESGLFGSNSFKVILHDK